MSYQKLLEKAPAHDSEEFIDFLKLNNTVVWENPQWIVVENFKYHTPDRPWYTAFWKGPVYSIPEGKSYADSPEKTEWYNDIDILWYEFGDFEWLKKAKSDQTINRFHIHLIKR